MHKRLKKLRKILDLTQQEFADRIGGKRNTVAKYETEVNTPSTAVVSLICREFNVNEDWLRNGTGGMFLPTADTDQISKQFLKENNLSKINLVSLLALLDSEQLNCVTGIVIGMLLASKKLSLDDIEKLSSAFSAKDSNS